MGVAKKVAPPEMTYLGFDGHKQGKKQKLCFLLA